MAREVTVLTWCDRCATRGERNPGSEHVGLSGKGSKVAVDLCTNCYAEVMEPLIKVLDSLGREPEHATVPARRARNIDRTPQPCPECGQVFKGTQSVSMHRVRAHGYRRPESTE